MKKSIFIVLIFFLGTGVANSQKNWSPFAGVHISASNNLYYLGPSFSAGVIHPIGKKNKWSWAPEVQYFRQYTTYPGDGTTHEWDKFLSFSVRSNFNYQTGKKNGKGLFIGGGVGFQKAKDECATVVLNGTIKQKMCILMLLNSVLL